MRPEESDESMRNNGEPHTFTLKMICDEICSTVPQKKCRDLKEYIADVRRTGAWPIQVRTCKTDAACTYD